MALQSSRAAVLPPGRRINGRSQADLADDWWKSIYAIPAKKHFGLLDDGTDPRGRRGSSEKAAVAQQNGSLLFLGGGFGEIAATPGPDGTLRLQRTIAWPGQGAGTLFLPILNASFDNLVNDPNDSNNITGNLTARQMQKRLKGFMNPSQQGGLVSELFASVDGQRLGNLLAHRQASEAAFSYTAPFPVQDGLLSSGGYTNQSVLDNADAAPIRLKDLAVDDTVTIGPAVSDGYWLAVEVMGGEHALQFGGTLSSGETTLFSLAVNYDILKPVHGSNGRDVLIGKAGKDYLDGGDNRDELYGKAGDDMLMGGKGNDVIEGGAGRDELWGDAGRDSFRFRRHHGQDVIFDFSDGETVNTRGLGLPVAVSDIQLASGLAAARLNFGSGDGLTFVGIASNDLNIQSGRISLVSSL
ncbi:MAG: calcium-binding protein [Cyanobium sp.]